MARQKDRWGMKTLEQMGQEFWSEYMSLLSMGVHHTKSAGRLHELWFEAIEAERKESERLKDALIKIDREQCGHQCAPIAIKALSTTAKWSDKDRKIIEDAYRLPQEPSLLESELKTVITQIGYEIEQARHHLEVAEKMGMEKRFSFVNHVTGFERLDGQLKRALATADKKE